MRVGTARISSSSGRILAHCALLVLTSLTAWCQSSRTSSPYGPSAVAAPPPISPELREQLRTIRDAALESDYAWRQLEHLTENIGPRPAGSPAAQAAAEYVADELRRIGLDVHLEAAQVSHWVRGEEKAELVEYRGQAPGSSQRLVLTALSGSSATPADGVTAEVAVVHSFEELTAFHKNGLPGTLQYTDGRRQPQLGG